MKSLPIVAFHAINNQRGEIFSSGIGMSGRPTDTTVELNKIKRSGFIIKDNTKKAMDNLVDFWANVETAYSFDGKMKAIYGVWDAILKDNPGRVGLEDKIIK